MSDLRFEPAQEDRPVEAGTHAETCRAVLRRVLSVLGDDAYVTTDGRKMEFGGVMVRVTIDAKPDQDLGDAIKRKARAVLHLRGEEGAWTAVHYHIYVDYPAKP